MLRAAIERAWWRPRASGLAWVLWPASVAYRVAVCVRQWLYRCGWLQPRRAPVPVVVVGNLVVGGAGKTPTVIALVQGLRERGWTPGVISRGYGSAQTAPRAVTATDDAASVGDEPALIRRRTGAPVWVGRQRAEVARSLCHAHPEVDLLVADDGLQHLALARDAQLVVFDERGLGNGWLLPAGPLRETWAAIPPRTAVIYNAPRQTTPWPGAPATRRLAGAVPLADWWHGRSAHATRLEDLRGRRVLAVAGIAAPERFFGMLEAAGLTIDRCPLPDHASLSPLPWPADAPCVLVTEKDAVKLPAETPNVWVVTLDFVLPATALDALLSWLPPPPQLRSTTAPHCP